MRLRVVALTTVASVAAKVISVSTSLIAIPLVLHHLGSERFGIWMIISSLPAFLVFMDFGIGNGVLNAIASANGNGNRVAIRQSLANGIALLALAAILFFLIFIVCWPWVNWTAALGIENVGTSLSKEADMSVLALGMIFFVSIPAALAQRAFLGIQKGFVGGLWQILANLLSFACVLFVVKLDGSIPGLVIAMFGVPAIVSMISAFHFMYKAPDLVPALIDLDKGTMKKFARDGGYFFVLQVAGALAFFSDQLIVSHQLGLEQVTSFSIYQKLFSPVPLMLSFVLTPLWAAYADAHARNDLNWIRRVFRNSILVAACGAFILAIPTAIFSPWLIEIWLGKAIVPNAALAFCFALWMVVDSAGRCVAIFLNGVGILRQQMTIVLVFVPLCLFLKIYMVEQFGLYGIPLAVSIAYLLTHVPGYTWILKRWFSEHRGVTA